MRRLGLACIAVFVFPSAASAQEGIGFRQMADGNQTASNGVNGETLEALTGAFMAKMLDFNTVGNLTQSGTNTVNTIIHDGSLGSVVQHFNGQQTVANIVALGHYSLEGTLAQDGTNIAGTAAADTLVFADQLFGPDARQWILNDAEIGVLAGGIRQRGVNIANVAEAEHAIGTAYQTIELGAVQQVDNRLTLAASASIGAYISQYGENSGNIMKSEIVESATRVFAGNQIVHNSITLKELTNAHIEQRGINIANLVQSSRIGSVRQISTGTQQVTNEVFGPDGQLLRGDNIVQTSDDVVNVTILSAPESGNDNGLLSVEQDANFPQSSNAGGGSQTGNSAVVNR